jgi:hypothetical protein
MEDKINHKLIKSEQWQIFIRRVEKYFVDWQNYIQLKDKSNLHNAKLQIFKDNLKSFAAKCLNNKMVN